MSTTVAAVRDEAAGSGVSGLPPMKRLGSNGLVERRHTVGGRDPQGEVIVGGESSAPADCVVGGRVAIASSAPHRARDRRYVPDRAGERADHALRDRRGRSRGPGSPRPTMASARLGPSRGRARGPKDTVGRDGTPSPEPANELSMEPVETVIGESFSY